MSPVNAHCLQYVSTFLVSGDKCQFVLFDEV